MVRFGPGKPPPNPDGWTLDQFLTTCGTRACAAGIATLMPEFQARGFHNKGADLTPYFGSDGAGYYGLGALQSFFDLAYLDVCSLFDIKIRDFARSANPKQVAAELRAFAYAEPDTVDDALRCHFKPDDGKTLS